MKTATENAETKIVIPYERVSDTTQATENKTGLTRQFESAYRTLAAHPGWTIDETFSLVDAGLSGYKGKNLDPEAALGGFLTALKENKIPLIPTKVLHIDDMSRLSRLPIRRARRLFEDILEAGVEIYDAEDNKLYTEASLDDLLDLIISLVRHEGAHEHSKNLADKVSKSYTIRKQHSAETGKPYRYAAYGWLKWHPTSETEGDYEPIPEKVKGVNRLFELLAMGLGWRAVSKRLNDEKHPGLSNRNKTTTAWTRSTVKRLLFSKAVLGYNENITPAVKMFPAIVPEKLYWAARAAVKARGGKRLKKGDKGTSDSGRNHNSAENLFKRLTKCRECGSPMYYHTLEPVPCKNPGSKGGMDAYPIYYCGSYQHGQCTAKAFRYDWFEESVITAISCSVQSMSLKTATAKTPDAKQVDLLKGQLAECQATLVKYTDLFQKAPSDTGVRLIAEQENKQKTLLAEIDKATVIAEGAIPVKEARQEIIDLMYSDWNATDTRLKARQLIRSLIVEIVVDIPALSYVIKWHGKAKSTKVEICKVGRRLKGYKISGAYYPSMGRNWNKATADIARYAKSVKAG